MTAHPLTPDPTLTALAELVAVVDRLRDPLEGCPWDLEQTHTSLIPYVLEEAHEVADAIRHGDDQHLEEELGDLLLQVVLHARIANETGRFDLASVARAISAKLIRRHPHVFARATASEGTATDSNAVRASWEAIKAAEREQRLQPRQAPAAAASGEASVSRAAASRGEQATPSSPQAGAASIQRPAATIAQALTPGSAPPRPTVASDGALANPAAIPASPPPVGGSRPAEAPASPTSAASPNGPPLAATPMASTAPASAGASPLSDLLADKVRGQPALAGAMTISRKAAAAGFEWDAIDGVWAKVHEEFEELREAVASGDRAHAQEELGDVLFTLVNVARWTGVDPEEGLAGTNRRFLQRFARVESALGGNLKGRGIAELEGLWQQAKAAIRAAEG